MSTYTERPRKGGGNEIGFHTLKNVIRFGEAVQDRCTEWRKLLPFQCSASEAQRIRDGKQTQVRRLVNPPPCGYGVWRVKLAEWTWTNPITNFVQSSRFAACRVGDVLFLQEPWVTELHWDALAPSHLPCDPFIWHLSQGKAGEWAGKLRPARSLPLRFSSPHRYEVTAVRCERVNEISEADALAEGCERVNDPAKDNFEILWNSIHREPSTRFADAPWVWVIELRMLK